VARSGLQQGFPPDTISTDLTFAGRTNQVIDLPNVVSKFLWMGTPLNQAIACVISNAACSIREFNAYGNLRANAAAGVTVLELIRDPFDFVDNYKNLRTESGRLVTRAAIAGRKKVA